MVGGIGICWGIFNGIILRLICLFLLVFYICLFLSIFFLGNDLGFLYIYIYIIESVVLS